MRPPIRPCPRRRDARVSAPPVLPAKAALPMTDPAPSARLSSGFRPRSDCAVIVACDARYLPYAALPALQLADLRDAQTGAEAAFDILIGSPDPLDLPEALTARGIGHVAARDPGLEDALPLDARRSLATYMEVFLARAARGLWRRILVIDADVQLTQGAPGRLMCADLGGRAVAAVRDNRQWRSPRKLVPEFKALGWGRTPYFNAGVVLIDTEAWAAQDLSARCADFARRHLAGLGRDQALVNGVLRGDWAELSPLWNWQFTRASAHLTAMADPCLIHFIGPLKPWLAASAGVVPMRWRAPYAALPEALRPADLPADLTARHWPEPSALRRALARQWRAAGPMLAYLARFADPYTVRDPAEV